MPVSVSAVVLAHDPQRAAMLGEAVASAIASGADEVVVVRPYAGALVGSEGRYRDARTDDPTPGGKHADGVAAATGDVVAFLDDDDLWLPEKVEVLRAHFGSRPGLVLLNHAFEEIDAQGRPRGPGRPLDGRWTLSSNLAVRRRWAAERTGLLREAGWEADEVWWLLADVDAPTETEVLDRPLTRWRYHTGNVSKSHRTSATEFRATQSRVYERWIRAETAMLRYARDHGLSESSPVIVRRRRRLAKFTFLAALEAGPSARAAARIYRSGADSEADMRRLAIAAEISPSIARYALFRFNRFH